MKLFTIIFNTFLLTLSLTLVAQPCTIQGLETMSVITPSGTSLVCGDALITLPNLAFEGQAGMPNPGIIWAIYTGLPNDTDPNKDPAATFNLLTDEEGNAVVSGGVADLSQSDFFALGECETVIYVVPIISDNIAGNTFVATCTGIDLSVAYTELTILNPVCYPEVCDPDCLGGVANDACETAVVFDLDNPSATEAAPYTNECATAIGDPAPNACSEFADFEDPYTATVWFAFAGNGGQYDISINNCAGSANTQLANPQMALYAGNCGLLTFVACSDNATGLMPALNDITTTNGINYYLIVDGFSDQVGEFCFTINEDVPPPPCDTEAGMASISLSGEACAGIPFAASLSGATTSSGYTNVWIVTDALGNIASSSTASNITINTAGSYTAYSLNYNNDDAATVLANIENGDALSLIEALIASNAVCADLSNAIAFVVAPANDPDCNCLAEAGTLTPTTQNACFESGLTLNFETNGTLSGDPLYTTYYVWYDNSEAGSIVQFANSIAYIPAAAETYSYAVLVVANEDIAAITPTPANFPDLAAQLTAAGACFELSESGTANILPPNSPECLPPCLANAGTLSLADNTVCAGQSLDIGIVGNNTDGFTTFYVVTDIGGAIFVISDNTAVSGLSVGTDYAVFALNLPTADADLALLQTATTVFDLNILLSGICTDYSDTAEFDILPTDSPECLPPCLANAGTLSLANNTVCAGQGIYIDIVGNNTDGFTTFYVLTDIGGAIFVISDNTLVSDLPVGTDYAVFALNLPTADADLALLQTATTVAELETLIAALCTDTSESVPFTVLDNNSPECLTCEPNTGALLVETTNCIGTTLTFSLTGNNTDGYTTYFVIGTDANDDGIMDDILQINSDATATLPEGDYLVQVLNIRNDFLTWLPSAPTTYVNLISSLFESCYSLTSQALSFSMVDCCEATTGIVTYPSGDDLNVCENTTATDISIQGAQTASNYQTLLVIVNSAGNVVASTPQTAINFTSLGLPLGSYTVYVINFELQHLDAITTFIASAQPWADFSLLTGGDACIAVDSGSATFTVIAAGTGNCLLPLAIDNLVETVSDDLLTYTVCFTILGGSGNYIVDGQAIVGNTYCSQPIACGTPYSFTTEDDMASSPVLVQGNAPCLRVCSNDAGIMPNFGGNVLLCADETTDYESVGYVLGEGDVLVYILHDEAGTELGNVFAVNTQTGAFSAASAGVAYNTVYYISAVVGLADANGGIIWADECTKVAEGIPVVFLSPIVIETDGVCNNSTGEYTLTVFVSGGVPSFIPTESYTLSGAFNGTVQAGQSLSNTFASGTTNYTIIANDGTCSAALSNTFECVKGTPIEWLSFEGEVLPQGNRLMWKTASENNSDVFVVERSKNGQQFEYVGKVKAAGTSNGVRNYSFLDKTAPIGVSYYRIVERDLDGSTNPSKVIILVRHQARFAFDSLSPMPATTHLDVAYTGVRNGTVQVAVYNAIGSLVEKRHAEMQSGTNILTFSLSNYVPGVYFIRLSDGIQIISERFVVNR